jgi:3-isopropylmalate/(R)-2-methylmalate dehydratase small subunit
MEKFQTLHSVMLPLDMANIDTDQILPARFLQKPRANDFGAYLFTDVRHDGKGQRRPEFVLNQPQFAKARIMLARDNFGCGSSREHAVWAIFDGQFRVVIAPSFGDIFFNNALKNGLLPIRLNPAQIQQLFELVQHDPQTVCQIDLVQQMILVGTVFSATFEINAFSKHCLLEGLDELGYTLKLLPQIEAFEKSRSL